MDGMKLARRKTWNERDDKEKIESLKGELQRTQQKLKSVCEYVSQLIEHEHIDAKVVVRLRSPREESCGGIRFREWEVED